MSSMLVLSSHMWLVATILGSTDGEHVHHSRKFCWTVWLCHIAESLGLNPLLVLWYPVPLLYGDCQLACCLDPRVKLIEGRATLLVFCFPCLL